MRFYLIPSFAGRVRPYLPGSVWVFVITLTTMTPQFFLKQFDSCSTMPMV
ncbi:MAG: hypothetical protein ABL858_00735 [Candidatus Nitrotoga sp.]